MENNSASVCRGIWEVGSVNGDEYYTRLEDAQIVASRILDIPLKVWMPFNDVRSEFRKALEDRGFSVVATSGDFFETDPPAGVQCVISNPPFSRKKEVLDRIKKLNLRFVLILPFQWLNDGVPLEFGNQLIFFRQRMFFNTPNGVLNKPRGNCFVLSDGLLKKDLDFVDKKKTKKSEAQDGK